MGWWGKVLLFVALFSSLAFANIIRAPDPILSQPFCLDSGSLCNSDDDCRPATNCSDGDTLVVQEYRCHKPVEELDGRCVKDGEEEEVDCRGDGGQCLQNAELTFAECSNNLLPKGPESCETSSDCGSAYRYCGSVDGGPPSSSVMREIPRCVESPSGGGKSCWSSVEIIETCAAPQTCTDVGLGTAVFCGESEEENVEVEN